MFHKDIERVYDKVESYFESNRYDKAIINVLSEILLKLEQLIIPKWQLENLGYFEVTDLKLLNKSQWNDMLSTDKGIENILFRLKSQDKELERYYKLVREL